MSKHLGNFYCLNCRIHLEQKTNLNLIIKYLKTKIFAIQIQESFIKRIDVCNKVGKHIPCKYSVSMIWSFEGIENK